MSSARKCRFAKEADSLILALRRVAHLLRKGWLFAGSGAAAAGTLRAVYFGGRICGGNRMSFQERPRFLSLFDWGTLWARVGTAAGFQETVLASLCWAIVSRGGRPARDCGLSLETVLCFCPLLCGAIESCYLLQGLPPQSDLDCALLLDWPPWSNELHKLFISAGYFAQHY